jgi:hypothetical protein
MPKLSLNYFTRDSDDDAQKIMDLIKSRENSIITNLFYGLLKVNIRCPGCKKNYINYDPFMFLPLAIPDKSTSKVRFKVFPDNYEFNYFLVEVFDISKTTEIRDVKNKIKEFSQYRTVEFDAILLKNKSISAILSDDDFIYDYVFTKIDFSDEDFIDMEIIFNAVENPSCMKNKGDFVTFYISPSQFFYQRYYLLLKYKDFKPLTFPKAFSISKKSRVKDLYIEVYKYYRRAMDDQVKKFETENGEVRADTSYYEKFYDNLKMKELIEKDFDKFYLKFNDAENCHEETDNSVQKNLKSNLTSSDSLFELFLFNNIPPSNSYFSRQQSCEYCNKSNCYYCKINFTLDTKIYELYAIQKNQRPFILLADFSIYIDNFYKFYQEFIDNTDPKNLFRGELTLSDCLDNFRKEEKLEKENPWYCQKCDKTLEAFKKTEIYSAPKYLIIQFKRFKFKGHKSLMDLVNNKKNESFVYHPLNNFNLSPYIVGPNYEDANYELISVNQHSGGLTGGHYTTVSKNNGKWFEFNDDVVTLAEYDKIYHQNSYILLYKKINPAHNTTPIYTNEDSNINDPILNGNSSINSIG